MAKTIFDLVKAQFIASFWTTMEHEETYLTRELFPHDKQLGLDLRWIRGAKGQSVVLKPSAFDAAAIPRPRIGFSELKVQMPYFKESMYIDEELRQQLNMVIATGNKEFEDAVMDRIFDDTVQLIKGAAARREMMRSMLLSTGIIAMTGNGQNYEFDYGVTNKVTAATPWATTTSDPIEDIRIAKETIQGKTGETLTRAMCDGKSFRNLVRNEKIRNTIFPIEQAAGRILSDAQLKSFVLAEQGIVIVVNDNHYREADGTVVRYFPENTFVMFPSGNLGKMMFGTTPAESDLQTSNKANVAIVDTGVAITTTEKVDPVQVETIVSQICLPSLERADSVYILNTGN